MLGKKFNSKRNLSLSNRALALTIVIAIVVAGALFLTQNSVTPVLAHSASPFHFVQATPDIDPDAVVIPADMNRLSWGAVLAGALLALIIQLSLNLLGIAIGATSIHPETHDSASPETLATGAAFWVGLSTLISLFVGGWVAARFAGIPNQVDGVLHGIVVWSVVMLISLFFLGTTLGRVISGVTSLLGEGLGMMGRAAQGVVQGVGTVAQGVAQGVSNVAQGVGTAAQDAAQTVGDKVQDTMHQSPEAAEAMRRIDSARDTIMGEARRVMQEAGVSPEQLQGQAQAVGQDVRAAAQQVVRDPSSATDAMNQVMDRLFSRGQSLSQAVANETDRANLMQMLKERTNLNDQQIEQLMTRWEQTYNQARIEFDHARQEAEKRLQQVQREAQHKAEEAKAEAERIARETAQATSQTIAKLAAAIFAAIIIGGMAAGIGGWFGAPNEVAEAATTTLSRGSF
jgi:hypothetical protein